MNYGRATFVLLFLSVSCFAQQKLLTPKEFLGYELGDRFTPHYKVVQYFRHVADVMPNIDVQQYGETYEHRPLIYAIVSSQQNFDKLEQIRTDNLKRAAMMEGQPGGSSAVVVWLSYNVHGNEANSMEASMWTLYDLANTANAKTQEWLKNTVVILDPCINPDGRDRYANFYNQYGNDPANASTDAYEHYEPWPGGRSNHYLFDLNRDWAWQTQIESRQRLKVYNSWLPHVHVDFHEQGFNSPYYFAPAAEPFHEVITPWQREFQTMIGKNNAKYFDEQGWLYFTKEIFDLYYPSYGDTYPTYSGAIGMTYEQGGNGFAGLEITTETGDLLTLKDRISHHHTTGLSTIEISSQNAARVLLEFEKYFRDNINSPASPYKTYVIKGDNHPDKIDRISRWMDSHGIKYGYSPLTKTTKGFDYQTHSQINVTISTNDIVISAHQPKSKFITTIFEPVSKLADSLTYDITAWNLMYAYDLKGFALNERINPGKSYQPAVVTNQNIQVKPYAYIFSYRDVEDVSFLTELLKQGVSVRAYEKGFALAGQNFDPGTLVVTRRHNELLEDFDSLVMAAAKKYNRKLNTTSTGFVDKGKDLGSGALRYIKPPRVAMLFGEQTSSLSAGEIWHFFEQQVHYPVTQISTDNIKYVTLSKYDVLIIPEGNYRVFDETTLEKISNWISEGGRLILISNAINSFSERKGFNIKHYATEDERIEAQKKEKDLKLKEGIARYEETERKQVSSTISGAIYEVTVDNSHPLGFGLGDHYFSLKTNELRFGYLENGWNVGVIKGKTRPVQGFAGFKANAALENSLTFGVEQQGAGEVIYLVDNPLFRSFWENGKMLFSNAVFMVGQ
jgi:hypothetical protein